MAHVGDITQLHGGRLPPVDIITFGSPCQGLSLAGQRRGLADERSGLFMEAIRIIYEMKEATNGEYPKFALWENVPGALSSAGGYDYQAVLEAFTKAKIPMPGSGKWANAGMVRGRDTDLSWCVYNAQHFGTAQRRRRVFLVADFRGKRSGEILFVPQSLRWYFEAGGTPRQGAAAFAEGGTGKSEPANNVEILNDQGGQSMTVEDTGVSPTLRSQTHGNLPVIAAIGINGNIAGPLLASYYKGTGARCGRERDVVLCAATGQSNAEILRDLSPTLNCASEQPYITLPTGMTLSPDDLIVRRLTPLECERLQGFPDHWTEYGHEGQIISDSKRYQMLGNSIAVPCAAYIIQGIQKVLSERRN